MTRAGKIAAEILEVSRRVFKVNATKRLPLSYLPPI